ncbi:MAG: hypothetical protein ACQEP8_06505 [Chlamydiota bacterium]
MTEFNDKLIDKMIAAAKENPEDLDIIIDLIGDHLKYSGKFHAQLIEKISQDPELEKKVLEEVFEEFL